jgi:hypothetical protein
MKLPASAGRPLGPVGRSHAQASFTRLLVEGVQPAALGDCYDNADCQTGGLINKKGKLCENCTVAQCKENPS